MKPNTSPALFGLIARQTGGKIINIGSLTSPGRRRGWWMAACKRREQ